jgi:hypothetical protein
VTIADYSSPDHRIGLGNAILEISVVGKYLGHVICNNPLCGINRLCRDQLA